MRHDHVRSNASGVRDPVVHDTTPLVITGGSGGSYNSGLISENREGANTGDGWITITQLAIK